MLKAAEYPAIKKDYDRISRLNCIVFNAHFSKCQVKNAHFYFALTQFCRATFPLCIDAT